MEYVMMNVSGGFDDDQGWARLRRYVEGGDPILFSKIQKLGYAILMISHGLNAGDEV